MKQTRFKFSGAQTFFGAVIGVLGIIGAQRDQAWANDLAFRDIVYRTDYASAGVGGLRNVGRGTIVLSGVTGSVTRAWLYWAGPMNVTSPTANGNITVNGEPVVGSNIGFSDDNCWGFKNGTAYRADVTSLVAAKGNGSYTLAGLLRQGTNINANGASLMVFFDDGNPGNDRDIVLFDGNDSNADNAYDALGWNIWLAGIKYTEGKGSIQMHVTDGQSYRDNPIFLNGRTMAAGPYIFQGTSVRAANNGPINNGNLWDIKSWDVTPWLMTGTNALAIHHAHTAGSDCVALVVAVINLPAGAAPPAPNRPPSLAVEPALTVNTPNPITLEAEASDEDGDELTCTVLVDGALMLTTVIPAGGTNARGLPAPGITRGRINVTNAFSLGRHTIMFTASDGEAEASGVMVLEVVDNTAPTLDLPANITVPAEPGKSIAVVNYTVTANDEFPGVSVVSIPPSGFAFPIGVTTVNVTAVDGSGNSTRGSFTVTVTDGQPPFIVCPTNLISAANVGQCSAVVNYAVSVRDNAPGATLVCRPPSGAAFPVGVTIVNCRATDRSGNTATASFTVTIQDLEKPVLRVPANITVQDCTCEGGAMVDFEATAADNCSEVRLVCVPPSGSTFPGGTNTVVCTATDASGNAIRGSFKVIVVDTLPPVIVSVTASPNVLLEAKKQLIPITVTVDATDNCGRPLTSRIISITSDEAKYGRVKRSHGPDWIITGPLTASLRAERNFKDNTRVYTITVECKDAAGNRSTKTTTVIVPRSLPKPPTKAPTHAP